MNVSFEDFKKVVEGEPGLTQNGVNSIYGIWARMKREKGLKRNEWSEYQSQAEERLARERKGFLSEGGFNKFKICVKWLSEFKHTKKPQISSYYIKHVIERLEDEYISNGACIAAALHLGIATKDSPWTGPNVPIAISMRCPYIKRDKSR